MIAVAMTWARKPYMVSRWAIRRRALQNSADVRTSTRPVWMASDANSPPPTCRDPLFFDFRQLSKKYLALPLCTMSYSVPITTRMIMMTTNVCMTAGDMDAESSANGLRENIKEPQCQPVVIDSETDGGVAPKTGRGGDM